MGSLNERTDDLTGEEFGDELAPGTPLLQGQYVIERFLKVGGFGMTYLARDSLDRAVVIKECFPSSLCGRSDRAVRARSRGHHDEFRSVVRLFLQEARRLAKLNHPNIVGVHQVFEGNETAYMALDYIAGDDLLDILEDTPERLSPQMICTLLIKMLHAVAYVHGQGLLHRDISPDNILVDSDGEPVLIDFGAAREQATKTSRVLSSLLVVKDGYSPQEFHLSDSPQGPPGDLYSLAATFYHLITGSAPPNSQRRLAAVAAREGDTYVPLAGRIEGYHPEFLATIDKAMSLFPDNRPQTAQDWLAALDGKALRAAAKARARREARIDVPLSALVEQTNKAVRIEQEREQLRKARERRPAPKEKPKRPFFSWQSEEDYLFYNAAPEAARRSTAGPDAGPGKTRPDEAKSRPRRGLFRLPRTLLASLGGADADDRIETLGASADPAPRQPGLLFRRSKRHHRA